MDRRIQKSKDAIIEAFVGLMSEMSFEQITINEIADRANVNRGTVYLHYTDKYDLLEQCIETHLNQLFESCLPIENPAELSSKDSLLSTFKYLEEHAAFYSTMLTNKGVPAFRNRLLAMALEGLERQFDNCSVDKSGMQKEIIIQFLASGVVGLLEWWMTHAMPYPATDMVEQFMLLLNVFQQIQQPQN